VKTKAGVAKALKDKGIPLPEEDTYDAMMHRLNTWEASLGFLFRRIKTRNFARQQLPAEIPMGAVVFVPASAFGRILMKKGVMFPLGRSHYNKDLHILIDVPKSETYSEPVAEKPKAKAKVAPKKKSSSKKKVSKNDGDNSANS
tara:strand:+ start:624 stop:1055 length:432 start_codon:yes stop_codon:yes gene_type:complete